MGPDLLIVDALAPEVLTWLAARQRTRVAPELALDPLALRHALRDARAVILPRGTVIDALDLHIATCLRAIGLVHAPAGESLAGSVDGIDAEACRQAGVGVVHGLASTARAEAEFMLHAVLSMWRPLPDAGATERRPGRELGGATIGLIGTAPAMRSLAKMVVGFDATLIGYDPSVHRSDAAWPRWGILPTGLRELLTRADAVCIQLEFFNRYRGLLGQRYLSFCKPGQVVVSLCRSALFDEEALAGALRSGRIAAAWLDHEEAGLQDAGRPLAGLANLCVTPRLAGHTRETRVRGEWLVAHRIDALLRDAPPTTEDFTSTVPGALPDPEAAPPSP